MERRRKKNKKNEENLFMKIVFASLNDDKQSRVENERMDFKI